MSLFLPDYYTCSRVLVLGQCCGNTPLFYWFQGQNFLGDDTFLEGVGMSKTGRIKYQGGVFFLFLSIKTFVTFYTKREIPMIKLMTALLF